ncbi:RIP metalloprotease RseP [Anthocerotibacter panamensis]|uniref:RIP metalloprotease RseP n=1 Tax=Anthocerotibacter panamensis TaxID=2857077 RepID=UPI001C402A43|nr:RIP metalloprotease RseP [Anthocerotibacter panamensis]
MEFLAAIGVLAFLIVIHELGHFLAARLQGIHANRFSIGFGPVLVKYDTPQTEYALRAFPLGGFVGFPDDDPDSKIPKDDPDLLKNRPILDRAIVMVAGVVANVVFAYVALLILVLITGIEQPAPGIIIGSTIKDQPAALVGIQPEDIVLEADGQNLGLSPDSVKKFQRIVENAPQKPLALVIDRKGERVVKTVTPNQKGKIGIALSPNILRRAPANFVEPFQTAGQKFWFIAENTLNGFGQLLTGKVGVDQLSSPVGIIKYTADVSTRDPINLLSMAALISFNLALLNILPIPGLDGSHLVFLLLEAVRGKPVSEVIQQRVLQTGLVFLMGLSLVLIFKDSFNWIIKGSPF